MLRQAFFPLLLAAFTAHGQNIDAYRYWFDDASASAVTTSVPPTPELVLNTNLPTGAMEPGYHRFTLQVRDDDGSWSVPHTTLFVRNSGMVNGYRYWLNDDVATLVNASLVPGSAVDLNTLLATSGLNRPFNLVTLQFRAADGTWSAPITRAFSRNSGPVDGYEYWIDDEIDARVTNTAAPASVFDLIADLPLSTTPGEHLFTIRFRTTNGKWSVPLSSTFSFVVGIEELPGISELLLFPNPATQELGLRLHSDGTHTLQLEVLDLGGRMVRDLSSWGVHGSTYRTWGISDLARGSYLLRISDGHRTRSIPFIKG
jgi:hypothetical protein